MIQSSGLLVATVHPHAALSIRAADCRTLLHLALHSSVDSPSTRKICAGLLGELLLSYAVFLQVAYSASKQRHNVVNLEAGNRLFLHRHLGWQLSLGRGGTGVKAGRL